MSQALLQRLKTGPSVLAPGAYDALSALLIEQAGFEAVYVSGASVAYTQLGRPDIGLVSFDQVADVVARIRERVGLPIIVDADTGFGNALNVQRTVRVLERFGATAIQIEDQDFPKRCGHLAGKKLISAAEMVGKIHAACDARDQVAIIATPMPSRWKVLMPPWTGPRPMWRRVRILYLSRPRARSRRCAGSFRSWATGSRWSPTWWRGV